MSYIDQSDYKNLLNKFAKGTQKQKLQENYVDLMPINSLQETKPTEMGFLNAQGSQKYADAMYEVEVDNSTEDTGVDDSKKIFVKQKDDYILLTLLRDLAKQFGHSGAKVLSLAVKFGASPELLAKLKNEFGQDASSEVKEAGDVGMNSVKNGFDKNPKVTKADFIPAAKKNEGLYGDGPHVSGQTMEGLSLGNLSLEERTELKNYVDSIKTTKKAIKELLEKAKAPKMEGGDTTGKDLDITADQPATAEEPATSATPGGRHAAKVAAMGTKPHQGPNVGPKGFDY